MGLSEEIGSRIRNTRKDKGIRQGVLADRIGVKIQTLCDYEHGRTKNIGIEPLMRLADELDVSVDWLLGRVANGRIESL